MEWQNLRNKRSSLSATSQAPMAQISPQQQPSSRFPLHKNTAPSGLLAGQEPYFALDPGEIRMSYFASQHPLYCADWASGNNGDLVALSSFREGFHNRIQIVRGQPFAVADEGLQEVGSPRNLSMPAFDSESTQSSATALSSATSPATSSATTSSTTISSPAVAGYDFTAVAEAVVDYPVTRLLWDPCGAERVAASSEVLRLYKLGQEYQTDSMLVQTHVLANNSTAYGGGSAHAHDINSFPPVTSFDWNRTDPSIIITSSVDTTCTVWDLNRSRSLGSNKDTAQVKTQLIAHDSEVFDVKFLHMSTDVFASVSNDGSMRVFDLRSLEHSTIIYEPSHLSPVDAKGSGSGTQYNPQALLKLSTSNIDQHYLATVGVNSNQVLIIDMRMPGVPVITIDGSFGGVSHGAINSIEWHPAANVLATGGDDCQALVWNCNDGSILRTSSDGKARLDMPAMAFSEELEVNTVCWRRDAGDWMGVVSGKGFQALETIRV